VSGTTKPPRWTRKAVLSAAAYLTVQGFVDIPLMLEDFAATLPEKE
jgi:hypothetical protein